MYSNEYFIMRHGKSRANEKGLIVSAPENGIPSYGLCKEGRAQIQRTISRQKYLNADTIIVCSDFLRTRETAALAAEMLKSAPPQSNILLRERFFGNYELKEDRFYQEVWQEDSINEKSQKMNVESPVQVLSRFKKLIRMLDSEYEKKKILLISHGDILQIALTWAENIRAGEHRSLAHLQTAELRPFTPVIDSDYTTARF